VVPPVNHHASMKLETVVARHPVDWSADDGTLLKLRPIRAEDAGILMSFVRGLSYGARYFRFGHGDIEFSKDEVLRTCTPDPQECVHLIVLKIGDGADEVIASGRIVFAPGGTQCEVALAVTDKWQKRGIGDRLLDALCESATDRKITAMYGKILASNRRMIKFMRGRGFEISDSDAGPSIKIATIGL
jgi:GNAT superfamily N-acetyltransferase